VSDEFQLSELQRYKLLAFISRADAVIGDGSFNPQEEWGDAELMALSLRAAQLLGYEDSSLERLFEQEFAITGVTGGDLGTWLDLVMLADVESRIKAAAGGRN
jgi:hypothetical protein